MARPPWPPLLAGILQKMFSIVSMSANDADKAPIRPWRNAREGEGAARSIDDQMEVFPSCLDDAGVAHGNHGQILPSVHSFITERPRVEHFPGLDGCGPAVTRSSDAEVFL
jgi:hypothetical protein